MTVSISYTNFKQNLAKTMKEVVESKTLYKITRAGHESVVIISESDFNSLEETLYLLSNKSNAEHLEKSIQQAEKGELVEIKL